MKKQPSILFICSRSRAHFQDEDSEEHYKWHAKALNLPEENFRVHYLPNDNFDYEIAEDLIIIGGSKNSTYDKVDWIEPLEEFIRRAFDQNKKMFGICFGHQIIAQALGGKVEPGSRGPETGSIEIELTKEGKIDHLFKGLPEKFNIAMFHRDVVSELPDMEVKSLAFSHKYGDLALAYGDNVRTVQFHPEFTQAIMNEIVTERFPNLVKSGIFKDQKEADECIESIKDNSFEVNGQNIARNFLMG